MDDHNFRKATNFILVTFLTAVIAWAIFFIFKSTVATNKIEFCYVEKASIHDPVTRVVGVVNYRPNRTLAEFQSLGDALAFTKSINCKLASE